MAGEVTRPVLTMPEAEAAELRSVYSGAGVILEYGMGGSTLLAAELPDKRIFSVESDANWLAMMQRWFAQTPPASMPMLHHGNLGATKAWGYPASNDSFQYWPNYVQSVWDLPGFAMPDVVLIDGRFRLACMLTVALRTTQPLIMLVDDYIDRPRYQDAEPLLGVPQMTGRMARFDVVPGLIPMTRLHMVIDSHLRPF